MNLLGIILGIATALSVTTHNRQIRNLQHVDTTLINWLKFIAVLIAATALITITSLAVWNMPPWQFFAIILLSIPAERLIAHLNIRALQESDQSLMAPLGGLTPIFLVPLGLIFLGEVPSLIGLIGIALILLGTITLSWNTASGGILGALRALLREGGTKYAIASSFVAAFAVILVKFAFGYAPVLHYLFWVFGLNALISTFLILKRTQRKNSLEGLRENYRPLTLTAGSYGLVQMFHYIGLSLMPAAYFIAIKRSSILFDVIVGAWIGKEKDAGKRFFAGILVIIGVALFIFA